MKITVEEAREFLNNKLPVVYSFSYVSNLMQQFAQEQVNKAIEEYKDENSILYDRLSKGRDYLMQVGDYPFDIGDCFESFGFGPYGEYLH